MRLFFFALFLAFSSTAVAKVNTSFSLGGSSLGIYDDTLRLQQESLLTEDDKSSLGLAYTQFIETGSSESLDEIRDILLKLQQKGVLLEIDPMIMSNSHLAQALSRLYLEALLANPQTTDSRKGPLLDLCILIITTVCIGVGGEQITDEVPPLLDAPPAIEYQMPGSRRDKKEDKPH